MKNFLLSLLAITIIFGACKKEESAVKGGINVLVTDENEQVIEGALVFIAPNTQQRTTNTNGIAGFNNLDAGTYQITVSKAGLGNGIGVAIVEEGHTTNVTVVVLAGLDLVFAPRIEFTQPDTSKEYNPTEIIYFKYFIFDNNTPAENISVKVTSDIDGTIYTGNVATNDSLKFSHTGFKKGIHKITVKATDADNLTNEKSFKLKVTIPIPVELISAVKQNKQVYLTWTECIETEFQKIEILRTDPQYNTSDIICSITDKSKVSFIDTTPPLATSVEYQVIVYDTKNKKAYSNKKTVEFPAGITFQVDLADAIIHPSKNWIYLVTKHLSWSKNSIVIYDYSLDKIILVKDLTYIPRYSVMADNGSGLQLFIPGSDSNIYIYSPDNLDLIKTIPTRHPCLSVDVNGSGIIIAGVSLNDWVTAKPVRTYLQSTGALVDSAGTTSGSRVKKVPNKTNTFISVGTNVSPPKMEYFEINTSGKFILSAKDTYHGDYGLSAQSFYISTAGNYSMSGNEIYSTNSTLLHTGKINHTVTGVAFNSNGTLIYTGSYNENKIRTDNYPSLTAGNEIIIKGFVNNLFLKGNKLVSLSKKPDSYYVYFIEDFGL